MGTRNLCRDHDGTPKHVRDRLRRRRRYPSTPAMRPTAKCAPHLGRRGGGPERRQSGGRTPAPVPPSSCRGGQAPRRRRHFAPAEIAAHDQAQGSAMSSHSVPTSRTVTSARPPGGKVLGTGNQSAVDEQDRMSSVTVGKRVLRGREAVVRHACRATVVDGVADVDDAAAISTSPRSGAVSGSTTAMMRRCCGLCMYRQLAYHRAQQVPGGGCVTATVIAANSLSASATGRSGTIERLRISRRNSIEVTGSSSSRRSEFGRDQRGRQATACPARPGHARSRRLRAGAPTSACRRPTSTASQDRDGSRSVKRRCASTVFDNLRLERLRGNAGSRGGLG